MGDDGKKAEADSSNNVAAAVSASLSSDDADFDMENLFKYFNTCYGEDGSRLSMDSYIKGYEEIVKFLNLLGTVFGWVASDVVAKIGVLKGHVGNAETGLHYVSIQTMTEYEVKGNMIKFKARDSTTGSRNLLRLQRALEYIIAFLVKCPEIGNEEKCCPLSQEAYRGTLMKYHPWIVQKAALAAMNLLPTKEGLIQKICHGDAERQKRADEMMPRAVEAMQKVYDKTQEVYAEHKLLELP